jgi:branched-subunit amino acid aminotransferase/4-amino-4-deoxychorismate lyase
VGDPADLCWIGGGIRRRDEARLPLDDSAWLEGRGCYTSVRVQAGRPRWEARHLRRLERGARALGLGRFEPELARRALRELARAAFPDAGGAIRIQLSRGADGSARVVGLARGLDPDPPTWRAIRAPLPHEGPLLAGGHKLTHRLLHALSAEAAARAGAEEALLYDRAGRLVEGARSNVIAVGPDERLRTPPLERGAVGGIAREILLARVPGILVCDLSARDLARARAIVCVNAVRGVRALARLDGSPVPGADHPGLAKLVAALAQEP